MAGRSSVRSGVRKVLVRAGLMCAAAAAFGIAGAATAAADDTTDGPATGGLLGSVTDSVTGKSHKTTSEPEHPDKPTAADPKQVTGPVTTTMSRVVAPALKPVTEVTEPITTAVVAPAAEVVEPAAEVLSPVTQPLGTALAPALEPVEAVVRPVARIAAPIVAPVVEPVADPIAPVTDPIGDVVDPIGDVVDPIVRPVEPQPPAGDLPTSPAVLPDEVPLPPEQQTATGLQATTPLPTLAHDDAPRAAGGQPAITSGNGDGPSGTMVEPLVGWAAWVADERLHESDPVLDWGSSGGDPWSPPGPLPTAPSCTVAGCGATVERPQLHELPAGQPAAADPIHQGAGAQLAAGYFAGLSARAALVETRPG